MNYRLSDLLLPVGISIALHSAVLSLPPWDPEFGRNTHRMVYPARLRTVQLAWRHAALPKEPAVMTETAPPRAIPAEAEEVKDNSAVDFATTHKAEAVARYFSPRELDERPALRDHPDLEGLLDSPLTTGKAKVRLWVNETGSVDRMEIEESDLPEALTDYLATQQEALKFSPGRKNGINVKTVLRFEITVSSLAKDPAPGASDQFPR